MLSSNLYRIVYFLLCLSMVACVFDSSNHLDTAKLDTAYFVGEYEVTYKNETEKLILKENMFYDYIHVQKKDTIIDAGKWYYDNGRWLSVILMNFPAYVRQNKIFLSNSDITSVDFSVSTYNMGDLEFGADDDYYIFVKLDKSKNKKYLKSSK